MNITDFIVDFIKKGNVVEFPGMGTLTSSNVDAYHDQASGTFYPARRTVVMNNTVSGNQAVIRQIAENECVSMEIAEQLWANYVGALKDKLQRTPEGHEFPGIGIMRIQGNRVVFDAIKGLDLDADKHREMPLENVATYIPKNVEDPFAAFEKPAPEPEPESVTVVELEPIKPAEPAPVKIAEPKFVKAVEPEPVKVVEPEPVKVVEPEPVKVAEPEPVKEAEPELVKVVEPEPVEVPEIKVAEPEPAEDAKDETNPAVVAAAAATVAAAASADHLSQVKKMLDEIPSSPKDAKEQRRAEKAAAKAEKEARKAAEEAEKAAAKQAAKAAKEKEALAREAEKAAQKADKEREKAAKAAQEVKPMAEGEETEEKKKKHTGLWIVIILLLLALAGGGYYYFVKGGNLPMGESCAQKVEWSFYDPADADMRNMLEFTNANIAKSTSDVHEYMAEYIHNYLLARHYSNAYALVMNQVDQYASDRLRELMVPGYSHKRFHPYEDFWLARNMAEYRAWGGRYYQFKVQEELMDLDLLDGILDNLISSLGLHADGFGLATGAAAPAKAAAPKNDKPYVETVPEAPTFRNSKQGFDIVAGFFTNKNSANKCANQLKALGSDAYVISKAGGYYVSMGSAPTRTAAEAMEKHIKSWYKSDVKIYNFNE